MKASTIQWHLARIKDTPLSRQKLGRFCSKHGKVSKTVLNSTVTGSQSYFENTYTFDNGGHITVELLQGAKNKGYTVSDHFKVINYNLGI